jgi:hypothetical protein
MGQVNLRGLIARSYVLIRLLIPAAVLATASVGAGSSSALAYGNGGGAVQLFQVTISANCDNPAVCGADNLGGFWAWGEFDQGGAFDAELTGCGHLQKAGAPDLAGAQHLQQSGTWTIPSSGPFAGAIVITSETDLVDGGPLNGTVIVIPSEFLPVGPAAKVKINTVEAIGFSAPGVSFNETVTPMQT